MKFYSELTKKFYETEDECVTAEKDFAEKKAREEEEKVKAEEAKKELLDKINSINVEIGTLRKERTRLINLYNESYEVKTRYNNIDDFLKDLFGV